MNIGVIVLRRTQPDLERGFRVVSCRPGSHLPDGPAPETGGASIWLAIASRLFLSPPPQGFGGTTSVWRLSGAAGTRTSSPRLVVRDPNGTGLPSSVTEATVAARGSVCPMR